MTVCFFDEQINYFQCLMTVSVVKKTLMGQALSLKKGLRNKDPAPLIVFAESPYDVDCLQTQSKFTPQGYKDFMPFPDLVNACDVAVSKPGYGIVSEIIANRTPLLYIARDDFIEYDVLVDGLQRFSVSELLPRERFLAGNWLAYLEQLLGRDNEWPEVPVDGAGVAASEILPFL